MNFSKVQFILPRTLFDIRNCWPCSCKKRVDWNCPCLKASNKSRMVVVSSNDKNQDIPPLCSCYTIDPYCKRHQVFLGGSCFQRFFNIDFRGCLNGTIVNAFLGTQFDGDQLIHGIEDEIKMFIASLSIPATNDKKQWSNKLRTSELNPKVVFGQQLQVHNAQLAPFTLFASIDFKNHVQFQIRSDGQQVAYRLIDDDKSISQKRASQYIKNPKTMSQLIKSMARNPPIFSESGVTVEFDQLQNGDFMIIDKEKMIVEIFDQNKIKEYTDISAPVKNVEIPKMRRLIRDFKLPQLTSKPLKRATEQDYKNIINEWVDKQKTYKLHKQFAKSNWVFVLCAPMGWGKTTRFPFYLQAQIGERLYITLPSIALATAIRDDLTEVARKYFPQKTIGYKISQVSVDGDIIVQTPGYLTQGVFNFIDEFQFITEFNIDFIEKVSNYKGKTMLSSATPFTPLIGCLENAGVYVRRLNVKPLREAKRVIIWGMPKLQPQRIPQKGIYYTTTVPKQLKPKDQCYIKALKQEIKGDLNAIIAHPNYVFGYNPPFELSLGVVDFERVFMTATNYDGVFKMEASMNVQYESVVQAMGRLARMSDSPSLLISQRAKHYSSIRFSMPRPPAITANELKFINQAYISRTKSVRHIVSGGDSHLINDLYPVVRRGGKQIVKLGAHEYESTIPLDKNTKSVYALSITGCMFTAFYESTFQSRRPNQLNNNLKRLPVFDRSTLKQIPEDENMETTPVGSYAIYNITKSGTSVLQVSNAIHENGINGIMLMNVINACGTKPMKSLPGASSLRSLLGFFFLKIGVDTQKPFRVKTDCVMTFKELQKVLPNSIKTDGGESDIIISVKSQALISDLENRITICKGIPAKERYNCYINCALYKKQQYYFSQPTQKSGTTKDHLAMDKFLWQYVIPEQMKSWVCSDPFYSIPIKHLTQVKELMTDMRRTSDRTTRKHIPMTQGEMSHFVKNAHVYTQGMIECFRAGYPLSSQEVLRLAKLVSEQSTMLKVVLDENIEVSFHDVIDGGKDLKCTGQLSCPTAFHSKLVSIINAKGGYNFKVRDPCGHKVATQLKAGVFTLKEEGLFSLACKDITSNITNVSKVLATSHIEEYSYDFGSKEFLFKARSDGMKEDLQDVNDIESKKFYKWSAKSIMHIMLIANPMPTHKNFEVDEIIYEYKWCDQPTLLQYTRSVPITEKMLGAKEQIAKLSKKNPDLFTKKTHVYLQSTQSLCRYHFFNVRKQCDCQLEMNQFQFEINMLLANNCYKCFNYETHCTDKAVKVNNIMDIFKDLWLLIKHRSFFGEQKTKSKLASKIKLFIQRKQGLQEIRKMIHLGDERQIQLHRKFNLHCSQIGVKPADIWLIIGLCLAGGVIGIGAVVALKLRDMEDHYEDVIRQDMCYNTKTAPLMTNTPNVVEQTQTAGLGFLISAPENVARRVMRAENKNVFRDLFVQNSANILFDRNNQIKQSKVSIRGDAGHKISGQARELASLRLQECITQPFIEFGTRKNDYIDQPCVMVSNRFDQTFKCIREDDSLGVYASINKDFMKYFPSTIAQWVQEHHPKYLLIRDSLHSPYMLQNAIMCAAKYGLTIYIVNHLPITDCDTSSRSLSDMSYTIERSGIKGWCRLYTHINGQREFSELVPSYEQIQRIALSKRFVAMIHPNRLSDNLVYGLVTINKGDNTTYNKPMMSHNHIGPYTYNEKGQLGKVLNAFEQNLIKHATKAQVIKMLSDDRSLITVAPPKTRSIQIGHQLSFGGRIKRSVFGQRTVNQYVNPSFLQCLTRNSTTLTRLRVLLANPLRIHGHETVDVTYSNCGLKYALLQSNHTNGRFNSDAWGPKQSGDYPNGYRRGNHATFVGEQGAVLNSEQNSVQVNGRSFKVQRIINKQKQHNLNYDIVDFNVISMFKSPQYKYIMYGPLSKAPKSLHISRQKYDAMIKKGWNRTVLPSFTYWLGGKKNSLPDLPTYQDLVNFCTCSLKKTPLIKAQDSNSMNYIEIKNCETCPINTLFSVLGRQCCARKNIDLDIAQQFEYFSDWVITSITQKMKEDGFKIDFSNEQVQEYINHVRQKDPWKGDKIKENFWKQIKVSDQFNLFVKIGQNHVVQFDPVSQQCSTDDVDPRLIAAPSFAIRGRVGLIAYYCLKWLKKQFPEFMLGKTPQQLEQYVLSMRSKPHTSESDWSKYDATQHKFLRACVDMTFFEQLYHLELVDDPLNQADRFFASVLSARFHSNIKAKNEKCVFRCQGLFEGTTFSGHPTCTSCGGTLRNFLYNLFGFWLERARMSFANEIQNLHHEPYRCAGGVMRLFPNFFRFMQILRVFLGLWVCGDDTGRVGKQKRDIDVWQEGMDRISSNNHDPGTHGLGLVIKAPKTDYKRIGILSKIFCLKDQTPIILRQIPRMILTNTSCSPSLTPSDCHYLAAMSFLSGSKDPLSLKLAQLRLSMIKGYVHEGNVFRTFLEQRAHKMLGHRQYTSVQCAFAYGMSELEYVALVGSISISNNCFLINFDYLGRKKLKSCTYGYGVASNLLVKSEILYQQDPITRELFKSPCNELMPVASQKSFFAPIIRLTSLANTVDVLTWMSKDKPNQMKSFLKNVGEASDKNCQSPNIKSKLFSFMGIRSKQSMLDLQTNYPLTLDIKAMLAQNGIERQPGPVLIKDDQEEAA